jgi:hypothetical protein
MWKRKAPTPLLNGKAEDMVHLMGMLPIRKIAPNLVQLTSYFAKLKVERSNKVVNNYPQWLIGQISKLIDGGVVISDIKYGRTNTQNYKLPRTYSTMCTRFKNFTVQMDLTQPAIEFNWDLTTWEKSRGKPFVQRALASGDIPCATIGKTVLFMTTNGNIFNPIDGKLYGTIEELLGLRLQEAPVEVVELNVMGRAIPMGLILGYYYGLSNLIRKLGVTYRSVSRGSAKQLEPDEFGITFLDQTIILSRQNTIASMIIGSLNIYHKSLAGFNFDEFNSKDVYGAVMDKQGLGSRYVRELDFMRQMYVDHITEELLRDMGEPTEFGPLLIRAVELLQYDNYVRETDGAYRREVGYERLAGTVFQVMVKGIRRYRARPLSSRAQIEINPNDVWREIQKDPSVSIVEESNPIHNLKEKENVTFGGTGGRTSRSLVRRTRAFDPNDLMVISEATVDSSDVGVTTFMSANPQLANLRGVRKPLVFDPTNTASLLSTSALISPCATRDDAKRANFINIQQSHVVAAQGYQICPLRTGYESVLAHRTDDLFAFAVKYPGTLTTVTPEYCVVTYDDPELPNDRIQLGRRYGVVTGTVVPHEVVCDVPQGTKLEPGHVVAYNSGFFGRDIMVPTQVVWKAGILTKVVIMDTPDTLEDSSAISPRLAKALVINTTEVREIKVRFTDHIRNLITVGEPVTFTSTLCTIEDSEIISSDLYTAESSDALRLLSRNAPRAKYDGVVSKIDVIYNGDPEDMTDTLATIVAEADKRRSRTVRQLRNGQAPTGEVSDLDPDTVLIKVYIEAQQPMGDGDKGVFANQLKTIIRRVVKGKFETESGTPLDAIFGYTSINDRIVLSPTLMGTSTTLLKLFTKRFVERARK